MLRSLESIGSAMPTMPTFAVPKYLIEVARLMEEHPLVDVVVDRVDGRQVRIGGRWLADFPSCNYLGFDLDPEILAGIPGFLADWGTYPSWSRALASPALYRRVEEEVAELLGVEDVLTSPTMTHTHSGVVRPWPERGRSWWISGPTGPSTTRPPSPGGGGRRSGASPP
jgi:hypothetical protein